MSVVERTDATGRTSYRARVSVRDPNTGKWTKVNGKWSRSRALAEREERRMLGRRDAGALASAHGMTVREYLSDEWLPAISRVSKRGRPLAPTTRSRYRHHVETVAGVIGGVPLVDLRASHVERLRDELIARGTLAPQTVADCLKVFSQALGKAVAKGLIGRNHADASVVDRPVGKPVQRPMVTPEVARGVLRAVRGEDTWDAAAHLGLGLSLRREEVLGLGWEHVDLTNGVLRVERTLTYADGQTHYGPPKSEAGERDLPIPGFVMDAIRRHHSIQGRRRLMLGEGWPLGGGVPDLLVDRGAGEPWLPATFSTYWIRLMRRHGFPGVSFHQLRHGTATLLLAAGVPDAVTIAITGHADTRILRRYQDVIPDLTRDALERLDALLGE